MLGWFFRWKLRRERAVEAEAEESQQLIERRLELKRKQRELLQRINQQRREAGYPPRPTPPPPPPAKRGREVARIDRSLDIAARRRAEEDWQSSPLNPLSPISMLSYSSEPAASPEPACSSSGGSSGDYSGGSDSGGGCDGGGGGGD